MSDETTTTPSIKKADSAYRVLARKYRPQDFSDLIGQEPMVRTLSNAFETGRIAQAYMLTGVRGVGKTSTARILARALNYKRDDIDKPTIDISIPGEHCQAIIEGRHVDIIEMDAASHTGIDDIRDLIESSQYRPVSARYKVYIIDEVHMLSKSAFNGLLKTLEEPPEHLKFIFATTEIRKVPITVLSRCQRFDLRRIEATAMMEHLSKIAGLEAVEIAQDALVALARAAEGSVRDSLSMLDQAIAHSSGKVEAETVRTMLGLADRVRIVDLFESLMRGDVATALNEIKFQHDIGAEPVAVLSDLADFIHYVTRLKYTPDAGKDISVAEVERKRGQEFAESLSVRHLGQAWQMLLKGIEEVKFSSRPLAAAEMVLVRLAHASSLPSPEELIRKLQNGDASTLATTGSAAPVQPSGASNNPTSNNPTSDASLSQNSGHASSMQSTGHAGNQTISAQSSSAQSPSGQSPKGQALSGQMSANNNSAQTSPMPNQQTKPQALNHSENQAESHRAINTFEELIFLVEDKRDIRAKTCLRRNVSLVHFEDGRMDVHIVGSPPPTFLPDLTRKLYEWTGKRWAISVSREAGAPTLDEVERLENEQRSNSARNNPIVAGILAKFPGSKVVDVRVRKDLINESFNEPTGENLSEPLAAPDEDDDELLPTDKQGLDDFFE